MVAVDKTRRFVGTGEVIAVEVWRGMWLYGVLLGQPQPPAHKAEFYSSANSPHSVGYNCTAGSRGSNSGDPAYQNTT
jgi:hypothetical protein